MSQQSPVSIATAGHYTWPSAAAPADCDGWHLHRSAQLSVIEERMPPGAAEQRHQHAHATQFFYVLAGTLTVECRGQHATLAPGQGLTIAPGLPHQVFNHGESDARFLVISQPPSHGDRVPAPR